MALLDDALALQRGAGPQCWFVEFQKDHPELVGEIEDAILAGVQWSALAKAARDKTGLNITDEKLKRHFRDQECACPRA